MPTTTVDRPAQGPTLEEAAERIEGLLDLREGNQTLSGTADTEVPAEDDEGVAAEDKPQETPGDQPGPGEAEAPEADDQPEATDQKDPLYTVHVDGKPEQITLQEALHGYQRFADYSRKTANLANDRRKLEEQVKVVGDERQTYATMLVALRDQLQAAQEAEPDWDDVYRTDPVGYARRRDEWRDKQDKIAAANFELQRVASLQQKENAENQARLAQKSRADMLEMEPTWKDPKVWESDRQRIVQYAQSIGYSPEEISNAYDPRAIVAINKARLWDELQGAKPKPVARRGPQVASAGSVQHQGDAHPRLNAAQQRLAKSGRIEDAAKVFEQLLR